MIGLLAFVNEVGRRMTGRNQVVSRRNIGRNLANFIGLWRTCCSVRVWNRLGPMEVAAGGLPGVISGRVWFRTQGESAAYP